MVAQTARVVGRGHEAAAEGVHLDKRGGLADIAEVVCVGAAGQSGAACGLNGDELDVVFALKAIGHEGGDNAAEV